MKSKYASIPLAASLFVSSAQAGNIDDSSVSAECKGYADKIVRALTSEKEGKDYSGFVIRIPDNVKRKYIRDGRDPQIIWDFLENVKIGPEKRGVRYGAMQDELRSYECSTTPSGKTVRDRVLVVQSPEHRVEVWDATLRGFHVLKDSCRSENEKYLFDESKMYHTILFDEDIQMIRDTAWKFLKEMEKQKKLNKPKKEPC